MTNTEKVAKLLKSELREFNGYLEDTAENIEAPSYQLNQNGKDINEYLHQMGIKTKDQVLQLSNLLSKIIG